MSKKAIPKRRVSLAYGGADIESIMTMLESKRPHDSKAEKAFIETFLVPLGIEYDGFGNIWKLIPGIGDDVLWSSHTDTVHNTTGRQAIRKVKDVVTLSPRAKANCLGADDTAGVWLMREMIIAGKPGLYVFHRGEEIGGLGSDYVRTHEPNRLEGIRAAIALDRMGYRDIITHQACANGCSPAFAFSLAHGLDLNYRPDDSGVFTDTANYFELISECTNISVGYHAQHSKRESLDIGFITQLRTRLIALDPSSLVIERVPSFDDPYAYEDDLTYMSADNDLDIRFRATFDNGFYAGDETDFDLISDMCKRYPDVMARLIMDLGGDFANVKEAIFETYGYLPTL